MTAGVFHFGSNLPSGTNLLIKLRRELEIMHLSTRSLCPAERTFEPIIASPFSLHLPRRSAVSPDEKFAAVHIMSEMGLAHVRGGTNALAL